MCSWRPLTSDKGQGSQWLLSPCLGCHFRLSPHPVIAIFLKDCLPGAPKKVGRVLEITFFTPLLHLLCPFPWAPAQVWLAQCEPMDAPLAPCSGLWTNTQHRKASFVPNISQLPHRPVRDRWLSLCPTGKMTDNERKSQAISGMYQNGTRKHSCGAGLYVVS